MVEQSLPQKTIKMMCVASPGLGFNDFFGRYPPGNEQIGLERSTFAVKQELYKRGVELVEANEKNAAEADYILYFSQFRQDLLRRYPQKVHIYYACEPITVYAIHSKRIIRAMAEKLYDSAITNYRFAMACPRVIETACPNPLVAVHAGNVPWTERKLACMLADNKYSIYSRQLYSAKRKIICYFEKNHWEDFDFYGPHWNAPYNAFRTYKGFVPLKMDCYHNYRFVFCFSNERSEEFSLDEKIFDAMIAGCVPVFYGTKRIKEFIPKECYIDYSDFHSADLCYQFLTEMDEQTYKKYLCAIDCYLHSEQAQMVHPKHLAEAIIKAMRLGKRQGERNFAFARRCVLGMKICGKLTQIVEIAGHIKIEIWCAWNKIGQQSCNEKTK
jgi:hypothetical protein